MQGGPTVTMSRDLPARVLVRQQIHVQYVVVTARAEHCGLFFEAVFFDDVQCLPAQFCGECDSHCDRLIWPIEPTPRKRKQPSQKLNQPGHVFCFPSSGMPRSGRTSPWPTFEDRIEHIPTSGSVISSMLARLNVTLAYSRL